MSDTYITARHMAKSRANTKEDGDCLIDLDVWVENQNGDNTCPGRATVRLPSRG